MADKKKVHALQSQLAHQSDTIHENEIFHTLEKSRVNLAMALSKPVELLFALLSGTFTFVFLNIMVVDAYILLWGMGIMLVGTRSSVVIIGVIIHASLKDVIKPIVNGFVDTWNWVIGAERSAIHALTHLEFSIGSMFRGIGSAIDSVANWIKSNLDPGKLVDKAYDKVKSWVKSICSICRRRLLFRSVVTLSLMTSVPELSTNRALLGYVHSIQSRPLSVAYISAASVDELAYTSLGADLYNVTLPSPPLLQYEPPPVSKDEDPANHIKDSQRDVATKMLERYPRHEIIDMLRERAKRTGEDVVDSAGVVVVYANGTTGPGALQSTRRKLLSLDSIIDSIEDAFKKVYNYKFDVGSLLQWMKHMKLSKKKDGLSKWSNINYLWLRIMRACGCRAFTTGQFELLFFLRLLLSRHTCSLVKFTAKVPRVQKLILRYATWSLLRNRKADENDCENILTAIEFMINGVIETVTFGAAKIDAFNTGGGDKFNGECVEKPSKQTLGCFYMGIGWLLMTLVYVLIALIFLYSYRAVVTVVLSTAFFLFHVANNTLIAVTLVLVALWNGLASFSSLEREMLHLAHAGQVRSIPEILMMVYSIETPKKILRSNIVFRVMIVWPVEAVFRPVMMIFEPLCSSFLRNKIGGCARAAGSLAIRGFNRQKCGWMCRCACCIACAKHCRKKDKDSGSESDEDV